MKKMRETYNQRLKLNFVYLLGAHLVTFLFLVLSFHFFFCFLVRDRKEIYGRKGGMQKSRGRVMGRTEN